MNPGIGRNGDKSLGILYVVFIFIDVCNNDCEYEVTFKNGMWYIVFSEGILRKETGT